MNDPWFLESFNGFFNDIIKLADFPKEDVETNDDGEDWNARLQNLEAPSLEILSGFSSDFSGDFCNTNFGTQKSLPIPNQSASCKASSSSKVMKLFQSSSPVSVFEISNGFASPENPILHGPVFVVKRSRSKRKRPSTLNLNLPFAYEFSHTGDARPSIPSPSKSETHSSDKPTKKKQKNIISFSVSSSESRISEGTIKKCSHCETTKTPQWREGPNGPKTLCNACGVRFRSGRLVPEYRPASSPGFVPSLHSNSHRKIMEMRKKIQAAVRSSCDVHCSFPCIRNSSKVRLNFSENELKTIAGFDGVN